MQALREIREITSQDLVVKLPQEFLRKRVEVIVLLVDQESAENLASEENNNWEQHLEALSWDMGTRLYATREELHERNVFS